MSYNDLIIRLHRVVTGPNGKPLRDLLRQRFHAALIDEFQDTDIEQWQIFNAIFGRGMYLYLIGDPKQAIYRFRGADINSYFLAREASSKKLTLEKNYRSHPNLVEEVNRIFTSRKEPFVFDESLLGFSPVIAAKKCDDSFLSSKENMLDNMVYCQLAESIETKDGRWTSAKAAAKILNYVVKETHQLLNGDVFLSLEDREKRQLKPHDIAILVRNNSHAENYLECFVRAGIPAVIASRKSVYLTDECVEMYAILKSLCRPGDLDLIKQAMTISWLGLTGNALYDIWQNEKVFDGWYSKFQDYAEIWHDRGFLPMMNKFVHVEKVFHNIGADPFAERKIANISQLLVVIQEAEVANTFSPGQTLQWLRSSMSNKQSEDELQLESDEEAVRIVTMHGAKGLEYPVVFCPFLWYRQARLEREKNRITSHEDGVRVVDLGSDQFEKRRQRAVEEEFAEDLRLLYVAVTRARLLCYIAWGDVKGSAGATVDSFFSPLGYLLFPEGNVPFKEQQQKLQSFCTKSIISYQIISADDKGDTSYSADKIQHELSFRESNRSSIHTNWQMTSYSALASISQHNEVDYPATLDEVTESTQIEFANLPAGANFGNVIHDILEKIAFHQLLQPQEHRQLILQICKKYGVDAEPVLLGKLLKNTVETPLLLPNTSAVDSFCLAGLDEAKCIKEMMFYFQLQRGETRKINTILARQETVVPLGDKVVEGYLTGFIDLVFQHNDKFYIVDYKTNHLGANLHDYSRDELVAAMASHNYGLQYWLYSLVLHRHLINFLPDYRFEKHFGGVFYLFVRGMHRGSDHGTFFARPDLNTLTDLDICLGGSK